MRKLANPPIKYKPTPEQADIIETAKRLGNGEILIIRAAAGAAKTTTLKMISNAIGPFSRIGYIVFNKKNAEEAKRAFNQNVTPTTAHALAYNYYSNYFAFRIKLQQPTAIDLVQTYEIAGHGEFTAIDIAVVVLRAITLYCQSDDTNMNNAIVEAVREHGGMPPTMIGYINVMANHIFDEMCDMENAQAKINHDVYLKAYSLDEDAIPQFKMLMVDESQDLSPVMLNILKRFKGPIIMVGDEYQSIYGWRGAVNAMQSGVVRDKSLETIKTLSTSFRFGKSVANIANALLAEQYGNAVNFTITTMENKQSVVIEPDNEIKNYGNQPLYIFRTNAGILTKAIEYIADGKKVFVVGGIDESLKLLNSYGALIGGKKAYHPLFSSFKTIAEARVYVAKYADIDNTAAEIKSLMLLVAKSGGITKLINALKRTAKTEKSADVILTTTHKAKGLEADTVVIGHDFPGVINKNGGFELVGLSNEEANILYVSVTRAIRILDFTGCPALTLRFFEKHEEVQE